MRSLTTQVAAAGGIVAIALVSFVGVSSFLALRSQTRDSLHETATHAAQLNGSQMGTVIAGLVSHLGSTAANPLIANALTDTEGRNAYVAPFLRGIRAVNGVAVTVTMTDYKGRRMASNSNGEGAGDALDVARRAIEEKRTVAALSKDGNGTAAELAAPIIYQSSGTAEGALVYRFDVTQLSEGLRGVHFGKFTTALTESVPGFEQQWGEGRYVQPVAGDLFLVVTAQADETALVAAQRRLFVVFLIVGALCLLLVAVGSRFIAKVVTRRLVRLEGEAARVVATASFSERFPVAGGDEVSRLAASFNKVLDRLEAAYRDLSEQAEKKLQDSETRYRLLAEHASDVIARVAADGTVRYISPAVGKMLGYSPTDMVGATLQSFIHPADRERVGECFANAAEGGAVTYRMGRKDGGFAWVEASAHRVVREDNDVVTIIRDVGRRKSAEDALAAKTVDLERSNAELEQFAYVASHDLREPLRMVTNYLQLIDRKLGRDKDQDMVDFMGFAIDGAKRMDRLILDMLEFSRVGRNRPEFGPVELAEVVAEAAMPFQAKLEECGGSVSLADAMPVVAGDYEELVRLFQNLIGNAVKYVPPDRPPQIAVTVESCDGEVVVAVADNGIGIAPEHHDRIFQIFQRLHGRDQYEGTGVGLAICKKIVDVHGGRIWVESDGEAGSVFRVMLPKGA